MMSEPRLLSRLVVWKRNSAINSTLGLCLGTFARATGSGVLGVSLLILRKLRRAASLSEIDPYNRESAPSS